LDFDVFIKMALSISMTAHSNGRDFKHKVELFNSVSVTQLLRAFGEGFRKVMLFRKLAAQMILRIKYRFGIKVS